MSKSIVVENVSYGLTVKNGDDYEKCHVEGQVVGGEVHKAINELKDIVSNTLRIDIPSNDFAGEYDEPAEVEVAESPKTKKKPIDKAVEEVEKKENTRVTRKQKIMNELDTLGVEYSSRLSADKLQDLLDSQSEEVEEVEEVKPKKSAVKEKVKRAKYQTYDRTIDEHMDMLCDLLDEEWPTWEDHHDLVKKQISMKLKGTEMLDEKGKMLDSFKDAVDERIEVCIEKVANS